MSAKRGKFTAMPPWAASLLALSLLLFAGTALSASPSRFWRIEVRESAASDGALVFRVTPDTEAPIEVEVTVSRGKSENRIARAIRSALREKLTQEHYRIDIEHGEDVVLEARAGVAAFELELVRSSVKDVEIDLHLK